MDKATRLAFRILASLYPDRRPSEIRKIIDDALTKEERTDDIELWMCLARDANETKKEETAEKKIIETHEYHHHYYDYNHPHSWWSTLSTDTLTTCDTSNGVSSDVSDSNCISLSGTDGSCHAMTFWTCEPTASL